MNARGTRRPHSRTPRPRKVKIKGGGGKKGCALILLAFASVPPAAYVLADVIWQAAVR